MSYFLKSRECDIDFGQMEIIYKQMLDNETELESSATIQDLVKKKSTLLSDDARTVKLEKTYFKMAKFIFLFFFSERVGDWNLQKHCFRLMIPIFHAAGHLAYAQCVRLMLQQMNQLKERISESEYKKFTEDGYFTIRRKNIYLNGKFTDQTIEQELMRSIKARGGLKLGRGITESTLSQWVHSIPYCTPICQYLEDYTGVFSAYSEQHKDLRSKTQEKDVNDLKKCIDWMNARPPLKYNKKDKLIIAT